jgi:hypothetical protein
LAPAGQDHVLRSSSVVQKVTYTPGRVAYHTFDRAGTEVLRLSFKPARITSGGVALSQREDLRAPGYTVVPLAGGDYVVRIRRQDSSDIVVADR